MRRQTRVSIVLVGILALGTSQGHAGSLADLIPNLFGPGGIILAPPGRGFTHEPHFTVTSQQELTLLNDALRGQLGNVPLPAPAGGFAFEFDPRLGVFTRTTESFGPIFAERAETIGRGKFTLGLTYTHYTFDELDGKDLRNGELTLTFFHEPTGALIGAPPFGFEADTVTARIFADITTDVFLLTATYGLFDNVDVAIAIPIIRVEMNVTGVAQINRIGTPGTPDVHTFPGDTRTVRASDESTGLGDILLRGKYNFYRQKTATLAAALDVRLPTGNADELRGVDTVRVRPFLVASTSIFGISPHINLGFDLGDTSKLENEFFYTVGFDWSIVRPVTVAFDVLGRHIIDNQRPKASRPPGSDETSDDHIVDAAIGIKVNPWRSVLLVFNLLIPLNSTGLRDDVTVLGRIAVNF